MMSIYGEISGRYSFNLQVGLSRLPYEPVVPGSNVFQDGFFRNTQWKPRMELQRAHASMHSIWNYEVNYINATGYGLGLQVTCFAMMNEKVASATTDAEKRAAEGKVALLAAWRRSWVSTAVACSPCASSSTATR